MITIVADLRSNALQVFSCDPEQAVVTACAQDRRDGNTWDYSTRYSDEIVRGRYTVSCGDFAALRGDIGNV